MAEGESVILYGIGVSPGIVIGRVLKVGRRKFARVSLAELDGGDVKKEVRRFKAAVKQAEKELVAVRRDFTDRLSGYASIIDSYILMLKDRMLYGQTVDIIKQEAINAEAALEESLNRARNIFSKIDDLYLRERIQDVEHVVDRVLGILSGTEREFTGDAGQKVILLGRNFSPADIIQMRGTDVLGFLSEKGGETSHSTIVARALGIPAVVGAGGVYKALRSGDLLIMDGSSGRVHCNPASGQLAAYRKIQEKQRLYTAQLALYAPLAAETIDGFRMRVTANIEMVDEVPMALEYGAQGIGLFRSEYQYIGQKELPDEEALFQHYKALLARVAPFSVTVRTLDSGGDKLPIPGYTNGEANPALGLRAIRFSLRRPEIFVSQLRALLRAGIFGNLRIMFPMITSVCEVKRIMEIVDEVKADLRREGIPFDDNCQLGIMIEVPSAVSVSDVLARMVDFFSIGTNDLIQYALAIDRGNEHVAHMYEPLHPAVLRMIRQVVDSAHSAGIEVSVCGEMASEVRYLPLLLGLGLDELSMYPLAVPYIKRMLRSSTVDGAERLVQKVFSCSSAQEVHDLLTGYLPRRYPDEFGDNGMWALKRSCCAITLSGNEGQIHPLPVKWA